MGAALLKLCKEGFDDEAIFLAREAKVVRKDMFQLQATFRSSFEEACQVNSVPQSLPTIVAMTLDDSLMVPTSSPNHSQAVIHIKHCSVLLSFCITTDWLEGTGWVDALVQTKVTSAGTADFFLKAFHIARTTHQVTARSLYILLKRSYTHYQ